MVQYLAALTLFLAGVALGVALEDWRLARAIDRLTARLAPSNAEWRATRVVNLGSTGRAITTPTPYRPYYEPPLNLTERVP